MKTLILGMGNPILTDDRVGILIARKLKENLDLKDIDVKETNQAGFYLIDLLAGYDRVIIIDSIKTKKNRVGTIYRFSLEDLFTTPRLVSIHEIDLNTAIELGKKLGLKMPDEVILYAVEIEDNTTFSEKCTPDVERAIPLAVKMILEVIK
ncbi:hypothetical protein DRQ09_06310 [candidate division KSB1 bacterium]|nr:MAG: hypothetical protein DRQ09_06310 [candidate division KSB1 bacterium]